VPIRLASGRHAPQPSKIIALETVDSGRDEQLVRMYRGFPDGCGQRTVRR
jgi:hypothetical protein